MTKPVHYGVIGLGPVGSSLAAHLAQSGAKTSALVRHPDRVRALQAGPIHVGGALNAVGRLSQVTNSMSAFLNGRPDIILIAVKSCMNPQVIADLMSVGVDERTGFVLCQNGIGIENDFRASMPRNPVLRMIMNSGCRLIGPDAVEVKFFKPHFLSKGERLAAEYSARVAGDLCSQGYQVELRSDIESEVFKKAILNSSLATVCTIRDSTMLSTMSSTPARQIVMDLVGEGIRLGMELKLDIDREFQRVAENYLESGGEHKPSMAKDIELGRMTENEQHGGAMLRLAEGKGLSLPITKTIYRLIMDFETRARERNKI